jgi:thioredoxin 1
MIERLIAAAVLLALGYIAYRVMIRRQMAKTTALAPADPLLRGIEPGVATIVYFTTPTCIPCKTQQMPALTRLQNDLGERVQIVRVDATEQPDAAQRWGVFSAPTTFVISECGETLAVNHGVADAEKLRRQLHATAQ